MKVDSDEVFGQPFAVAEEAAEVGHPSRQTFQHPASRQQHEPTLGLRQTNNIERDANPDGRASTEADPRDLWQSSWIPEPYVSAFYDWGADSYGGGYHAWAGGSRVPAPWDVAKRMRKPFDDLPVHICGEAYSDQQAWVEGSLCSTELMLQEHFGMAYPDWMPPNYYFGW